MYNCTCFSIHLCVLKRVVDHLWRVAHCTVGRMPHCRLPHSNTPTEHGGKECTYQVFIPLSINQSTLFSKAHVCECTLYVLPFLYPPLAIHIHCTILGYDTSTLLACNCFLYSSRLARISTLYFELTLALFSCVLYTWTLIQRGMRRYPIPG